MPVSETIFCSACRLRANIGGTFRARAIWPTWCSKAALGSFVAGIEDTDSGTANTYGSFLIPIGVGLDYAVTERLALTTDFLLNFTSLGETVRARGQEFDLHTNVMPAFYIGIRF